MEKNKIVEIEEPIGNFIIDNSKGTQTENGVYYHYSDVCKLLKDYKKQLPIPKISGDLSSIKKGDKLLIKNNFSFEIGNCLNVWEVTQEDEKSFLAGDQVSGWWFYKDSLEPYSGDATIIGVINN